jgi:hypothetical protein
MVQSSCISELLKVRSRTTAEAEKQRPCGFFVTLGIRLK